MSGEIFASLREPFPAASVSWRVGSTTKDKSKGLPLAYIDARDVMERLDDVLGPESWQSRYTHAAQKTVCEIGIKINAEWLWKANGAGDTDFEGEKGAMSDAFKRAAVLWGIGRYLYDIKSPWVEIEPQGRSYRIKSNEYDRLHKILEAHGAPPERSAASLKRTDENGDDEWAKITKQLGNEFLDCHSEHQLSKLRAAYKEIVTANRWPQNWRESLTALFDEKKRELNKEAA